MENCRDKGEIRAANEGIRLDHYDPSAPARSAYPQEEKLGLSATQKTIATTKTRKLGRDEPSVGQRRKSTARSRDTQRVFVEESLSRQEERLEVDIRAEHNQDEKGEKALVDSFGEGFGVCASGARNYISDRKDGVPYEDTRKLLDDFHPHLLKRIRPIVEAEYTAGFSSRRRD